MYACGNVYKRMYVASDRTRRILRCCVSIFMCSEQYRTYDLRVVTIYRLFTARVKYTLLYDMVIGTLVVDVWAVTLHLVR